MVKEKNSWNAILKEMAQSGEFSFSQLHTKLTSSGIDVSDISKALNDYVMQDVHIIDIDNKNSKFDSTIVTIYGAAQVFGADKKAVAISFELKDSKLQMKFEILLPKGWKFTDSFPALSQDNDFRSGKDNVFSTLVFTDGKLILISQNDGAAKLEKGLNFRGNADISTNAFFQKLHWSGKELPISGRVDIAYGKPKFLLAINQTGQINIDNVTDWFNVQVKPKLISELKLNPETQKQQRESYLQLETDFQFAEKKLSLFTKLKNAYDLIELEVDPEQIKKLTKLDVSKLFNFIKPKDNSSLPVPFADFNLPIERPDKNVSLSLANLKFLISPTLKYLVSVTAIVDLDPSDKEKGWTVLEQLTIKGLEFVFTLHNPLSPSRHLNWLITGNIDIGVVPLTLSVNNEGLLTTAVRSGEKVNLINLLERFLPKTITFPDYLKLELDELSLSYQLLKKEFHFIGDVRGNVPLGTEKFTMSGLRIELDHSKYDDSGFTSGELSGQFILKGKNNDIYLDLRAAYADPAEGFEFEGALSTGGYKAGTFIENLAHNFNSADPVPAVANFAIDDLYLSYHTKSKEFKFNCTMQFPLNGDSENKPAYDKAAILSVKVELSPLTNGYSAVFGGSLNISNREFDIVFGKTSDREAKTDTNTLAAAYNNPKGDEIKLKDFISLIATDVDLDGFDVSVALKNAQLIYHQIDKQIDQNKKETTRKFLFGIELDAGINLSNLPLVGQLFEREQTLTMAFQAIAAYSNKKEAEIFSQKEIESINKLTPETTAKFKDNAIKVPFNLAATLHLGDITAHFDFSNLNKDVKEEFKKPVTPKLSDKNKAGLSMSTSTALSVFTESAQPKWVSIQKNFGPVHLERIGVAYADKTLKFLLDASLTAAGLTLSLNGLGAEFKLEDIQRREFKPKFCLDGLGVDYSNGAVEIGGALLHQKLQRNNKEVDEYQGTVVVKMKTFSLVAMGAYSTLEDGSPSLFVYGLMNYPIGGPPCFFIDGLAAGFGYNRSLTVPTIDKIESFPLVAEALQKPAEKHDPMQELAVLHDYIQPAAGEYFFAVGVKFTSFKMIQGFLLLAAKLGTRFELNILGLADAVLPTPETGKSVDPFAEIQLAVKASFIPDDGFIGVQAQLTSRSYVFSKNGHINGGFAFYTWFNGLHKDDFALTVGGYHRNFNVPAHYPQVPRLELNWQVNADLSLKANAYFALVPSALMGGGYLAVNWQSGNLKAWFNAGVDFLMAWKPYHYKFGAFVNIGASYTFDIFGYTKTVTTDLSANVDLWGPEFSGTAHISWWAISFDIRFGNANPDEPAAINKWEIFANSFLPNKQSVCTIAIEAGLLSKSITNNNDTMQIKDDKIEVNPQELRINLQSVVPINKSIRDGKELIHNSAEFGVGPMDINAKNISSEYKIIVKQDGNVLANLAEKFDFFPILKNMPVGIWGTELKPNLAKSMIADVLCGFQLRPKASQAGETQALENTDLLYNSPINRENLQWNKLMQFKLTQFNKKDAEQKINDTIIGNAKRYELLEGIGMAKEVDLGLFDAKAYLQAPLIQTAA